MSRLIELAHARGSQHVAVVFVHGLGGDPLGTWTSGKDVAAVWPKWLAEDLEGVAVWSVDYEAPMSDWRGSAMELTDRAANVLNLLLVKPDLREGQLILVGHSLGGLVIKQVLRKAADAATERADVHSFIERVRKVVFLATPHVGADLASWGDRLRVFVRPSAAARSLLRNDSHLRDLNLWYRRWAKQRGIDHLILTETKTTMVFGMAVKPDSSDPGLASDPVPIDTDHIEIAKPANRQSLVYQLVCNFIVRQAGRPVSHEERKIDAVKDDTQEIRQNVERLTAQAKFRQDVLSPIPVTHRLKIQKFVEFYLGTRDQPVPFGGRRSELNELTSWLTDTSAPQRMLITAPAGRGKTALLVRWMQSIPHSWKIVFVPISIRVQTNHASIFYEAMAHQLARIAVEKAGFPPSNASEFFKDRCLELLYIIAEKKIPTLVIVDGLDEASGWEIDRSLLQSETDSTIRIIASARTLAGDPNDPQGWCQKTRLA